MNESQRQRLERAVGTLQRTHAAYEAKIHAFSLATGARGTVETELTTARRIARFSSEAAERLTGISAELEVAKEGCQAAQGEMEAAREVVVGAVRAAGYLIQNACAPLLEQFRNQLAESLRAFCVNPEGTAAAIPEHRTEFPSLARFLQRGQHLSRIAAPEEIEWLVFDLSQTLRRILGSEDIWRLPGEGRCGAQAAETPAQPTIQAWLN